MTNNGIRRHLGENGYPNAHYDSIIPVQPSDRNRIWRVRLLRPPAVREYHAGQVSAGLTGSCPEMTRVGDSQYIVPTEYGPAIVLMQPKDGT